MFSAQNKVLFIIKGKIIPFLVVSANLVSNRNSLTVESCVTRKLSNISRYLWKNVKNWCFIPKMKVFFLANCHIIHSLNVSANVMSNHNLFTVE